MEFTKFFIVSPKNERLLAGFLFMVYYEKDGGEHSGKTKGLCWEMQ